MGPKNENNNKNKNNNNKYLYGDLTNVNWSKPVYTENTKKHVITEHELISSNVARKQKVTLSHNELS